MERNDIANILEEVCGYNKIDDEGQLAFDIMTRQELIDTECEDEKDPLYGNDYDWVIIYNDNPDYLFISNNDALSQLAMQIDDWFKEIKIGNYKKTGLQ